MKLVSGKCPNCGANVELDNSLTTTYCAYCGSQISVEEAVEKLKIELSGKIEVDGINSLNKLYKNAESYIKLKDFNNAFHTYESIINDNPEEIEAYKGALLSASENMTKQINLKDPNHFYPSNFSKTFDKYLNYIETLDEAGRFSDFVTSFKQYREQLNLSVKQYENQLKFSKKMSSFLDRTRNCENFLSDVTNTSLWSVETVNSKCKELINIYNELSEKDKTKYKTQMEKAIEYSKQYSNPLNHEKIEKEEENSDSGCLAVILKLFFFIFVLPTIITGVAFAIFEIMQ